MTMPDISVVIVSYNTKDLLDQCIESIFRYGNDIVREVIVIDNASADGSRDMLMTKWPNVRVISNKENCFYAPACNQGLREATGEYILALNSDAFLTVNALHCLKTFLEKNPDVAAAGPKLLNKDGSIQYPCARREPTFFTDLFYLICIGNITYKFPSIDRYVNLYEPEQYYQLRNEAKILSGACILFRSSALKKIGFLDERLFLLRDDTDWCIRARKKGYKLFYLPDAEVIHVGLQSRSFNSSESNLKSLETYFRFFELYYNRLLATSLKLVILGLIILSIIKNIVLYPFNRKPRKQLPIQLKLFKTLCPLAFRLKILRP